MTAIPTISVDAMGGDLGPQAVVEGIGHALKRWPDRKVKYLLHGDEALLKPLLDKNPKVAAVCELRHTDTLVQMTDKPSEAVRRARGSSMWNAIQSVKAGEAGAIVSSGRLRLADDLLRVAEARREPLLHAAAVPDPHFELTDGKM